MLNSCTTYKELLTSLNGLHLIDQSDQQIEASMAKFKQYIVKNWNVLSKFTKATADIKAFLNGFGFDAPEDLNLMMTDLDILLWINQIVESNRELLNKYKGCREDFMDYLSKSLHSPAKDDKEVVMHYIDVLLQVDKQISVAEKEHEKIRSNQNRHDQQIVSKQFLDTINAVYQTMHFYDVENYMAELNSILDSVHRVEHAFQKEHEEFLSIRQKLKSNSFDMWEEDRKSILQSVESLMAKDFRRAEFSLHELKERIERAVVKRRNDIGTVVERHGWLANSKYSSSYQSIVASTRSLASFQSQIDALVKERNKKVWKGVGITFGVAIGIAIIVMWWRAILFGIIGIAVLGVASLFGGSKD